MTITNKCRFCSQPRMKTKDECETCRRGVLKWHKESIRHLVERIVLEAVWRARKEAVAAERRAKLPEDYETINTHATLRRRTHARPHTSRRHHAHTVERRVQ